MKYFLLIPLLLFPLLSRSQSLSAEEIVRRAEENLRGGNSYSEMKMTIVRPEWTRETTMKSWSKGKDRALILVTAPARDKGIAYLKRSKDIWNWQPAIERTIKLPPSMMSQSWLGSDFTNDDLIRESSMLDDYHQKLLDEQETDGRMTYRIELTPKEGTAVVWGKIITWITREHYMQIRTEFYDEDGFLINTMKGSEIKDFGKRRLPSKLTVIPEENEGHQTIVEYKTLQFDQEIDDGFFTIQNMKSVD